MKIVQRDRSASSPLELVCHTAPPLTHDVYQRFESLVTTPGPHRVASFSREGDRLRIKVASQSAWSSPELKNSIEALLTKAENEIQTANQSSHQQKQMDHQKKDDGTNAAAKAFGLPVD